MNNKFRLFIVAVVSNSYIPLLFLIFEWGILFGSFVVPIKFGETFCVVRSLGLHGFKFTES